LHAQRVCLVLVVSTVGELHHVQHSGNVFRRALLNHRSQLEVLLPGKVGIEDRVFQHGTNSLSRSRSRRLAKPGEASGGWVNHTHQHTQRCRFSTAIRSEHAEYLAALDFEMEVINGANAPKLLGETGDSQYGFQ